MYNFTFTGLRLFFCILVFSLSACVSTPPRDVNNICGIFRQYPSWYTASKVVEKRWKLPVSVQMAIIYQESKFDSRAAPARRKRFLIIPWDSPSSAYGYTQALRTTWAQYKKTDGGRWATRDNFSDGVNFIGWYAYQAYKRAGIISKDTYALYLAYHEGIGGYQRKTYLNKSWLIQVAKKVRAREAIYAAQLKQCA
jgi:hypothetical protein